MSVVERDGKSYLRNIQLSISLTQSSILIYTQTLPVTAVTGRVYLCRVAAVYLFTKLKLLKYTFCSSPLLLVMRSLVAVMPPSSLPVWITGSLSL